MNSYKNQQIRTLQFVYNLYTICTVRITLYELCCTSSYNKKKRNKNSHKDSNHGANNDPTHLLPASGTAQRTADVFYNI